MSAAQHIYKIVQLSRFRFRHYGPGLVRSGAAHADPPRTLVLEEQFQRDLNFNLPDTVESSGDQMGGRDLSNGLFGRARSETTSAAGPRTTIDENGAKAVGTRAGVMAEPRWWSFEVDTSLEV
jgi:hypothetical protein